MNLVVIYPKNTCCKLDASKNTVFEHGIDVQNNFFSEFIKKKKL